MDDDEKKRRAAEARRLLNEPLLVEALDTLMGNAYAEFKAMTIRPETIHEVIALQERINILQGIVGEIQSAIFASGEMDGGVPMPGDAPQD